MFHCTWMGQKFIMLVSVFSHQTLALKCIKQFRNLGQQYLYLEPHRRTNSRLNYYLITAKIRLVILRTRKTRLKPGLWNSEWCGSCRFKQKPMYGLKPNFYSSKVFSAINLINMSKTCDCERNLSSIITKGNQMVYSRYTTTWEISAIWLA